MKYIPGHTFKVTKALRGFEVGKTYRVYHIAPQNEGIQYIFVSDKGRVDIKFKDVEEAELVIEKASK